MHHKALSFIICTVLGPLSHQGDGTAYYPLLCADLFQLPQAAFAAKVGLGPSNFHKKLRGMQKLTPRDIKMICEANGITEDYLHSIDLLPENHRAALMKTYPAKPENGPMISALAAELSIFENLMKRVAR